MQEQLENKNNYNTENSFNHSFFYEQMIFFLSLPGDYNLPSWQLGSQADSLFSPALPLLARLLLASKYQLDR